MQHCIDNRKQEDSSSLLYWWLRLVCGLMQGKNDGIMSTLQKLHSIVKLLEKRHESKMLSENENCCNGKTFVFQVENGPTTELFIDNLSVDQWKALVMHLSGVIYSQRQPSKSLLMFEQTLQLCKQCTKSSQSKDWFQALLVNVFEQKFICCLLLGKSSAVINAALHAFVQSCPLTIECQVKIAFYIGLEHLSAKRYAQALHWIQMCIDNELCEPELRCNAQLHACIVHLIANNDHVKVLLHQFHHH